MSDTDNFISEVTEQVQQDRLYKLARKYGWIVALIIIAIVGLTIYFEYSKASKEAASQDRGDAIFAALNSETENERVDALKAIDVGDAVIVKSFLLATAQSDAGLVDEALATLTSITAQGDAPQRVRDLAQLKIALLPDAQDAASNRLILETLSNSGGPYASLAKEFLAMELLKSGDAENGIRMLTEISESADTSRDQGSRVGEVLLALGVTQELANEAVAGN